MTGTATQYLPLLFILIVGGLWLRKPQDKWLHLLVVAGSWIPVVGGLMLGLERLTNVTGLRYDEWFLVVDGWFGYPSFAAGRLLQAHHSLELIVLTDYISFVLVVLFAVAANFALVSIRGGYRVFWAVALSCFLAAPIYATLPASGPRYAFAGFPYRIPQLTELHALLIPGAPPNCMPSVHMTLALLVAAFVWRWRAGKALGALHVALTALATLGLGEHYLIDLIAAVPYAIAIYWLSGLRFSFAAQPVLETNNAR